MVGVSVGDGVGVMLGVSVGAGVSVGSGVIVGTGVRVGVLVGVGVSDGIGVMVGTGVAVKVGLGVRVGVGVICAERSNRNRGTAHAITARVKTIETRRIRRFFIFYPMGTRPSSEQHRGSYELHYSCFKAFWQGSKCVGAWLADVEREGISPPSCHIA
jgi:hypothetical protein